MQRAGWALMALVALAALAGLVGPGPLSTASAGEEGAPLVVESYERFLRFGKPTALTLRLGPAATGAKACACGWTASTWRAYRFGG